jgi:hypothetical protein
MTSFQPWTFRIARGILLLLTGFLAFAQVEGTLFGIGDGDGKVISWQGILLAVTALGILVLLFAAFGSFSRNIAFAFAGLTGGLLVLPMAVLFGWGQLYPIIVDSLHGIHTGTLPWVLAGGALPFSLTTIFTSRQAIKRNADVSGLRASIQPKYKQPG